MDRDDAHYLQLKSYVFHSVVVYTMVFVVAYLVFNPWMQGSLVSVLLISNAFAGVSLGWVRWPMIEKEYYKVGIWVCLTILKIVVVVFTSGIYILLLIGNIMSLFLYFVHKRIKKQEPNQR